jgi:hypothetical protein
MGHETDNGLIFAAAGCMNIRVKPKEKEPYIK